MSKQDSAMKHWETGRRMDRIRDLMHDARDYSFPAGQMQAGIQMATVEVPWLLNYIEELRSANHDARQESGIPALGLQPQALLEAQGM